jgi:SAM-dependent methyltransferase
MTGPGSFTDDGCPVEVYRLLPSRGEPEFIHGRIPPACSILDLGAGTGRIADPLVAMGHRVIAVDNSPAMLAHVQRAETALADIVAFRDRRTFTAVILASSLINNPDPGLRHGFLATVAHHLDHDGTAFIQWFTPDWFDQLTAGATRRGTIGPLASVLQVASVDDGVLEATVSYELGTQAWSQTFQSRRLTVARVEAELAAAGLRLVGAEHHADMDWLFAAPAS